MTKTITVLRDRAGLATGLRTPLLRFEVVQGPDRGRTFRGGTDRVLVGTGATCNLQLTDPTVSEHHAEVIFEHDGLRIRDLDSKNGTYLGEYRIFEASLSGDDLLRVGDSVVKLVVLDSHEDRPLSEHTSLGRLRGSSVRMRQLYGQILKVAASDSPALVSGATGTGKEAVAETIVNEGPRNKRPFVVVDCPALAPALAESELFGHEGGAFSGAVQLHRGAFERAHTGTLLLDEIGELSLELQAKLLGVLSRMTVQRVGASKAISVDVRVIATTQHDLEREVNRGAFRADLYFRIASLTVRVPRLDERREDIPELIAHFLSELPSKPRLRPDQIRILCERTYQGNLTELKSAVQRLALGLNLDSERAQLASVDSQQPFQMQKEQLIAQFESQYIKKVLEECQWNVAEAARRSGLNRTHLYRVIGRLKR